MTPRSEDVAAVLLVAHSPEQDYHHWVVLPGWKGAPVTVRRDAIGRRRAKGRSGHDWLVLICNNSACPGRCAVKNDVIEELAERSVPARRWGADE